MTKTTDDFATAIRMAADAIENTAREAGPLGAPSGVVYSAMMTIGMNLDTYQAILAGMVAAGRITVENDLIHAAN